MPNCASLDNFRKSCNATTPASPRSGRFESFQEKATEKAPDIAGALVEGVPLAGPLLREMTKATTEHFLDTKHQISHPTSLVDFQDPLSEATQAFIADLNQMAETKIKLSSGQGKRERRIILCFDTFEKMALTTAPWLLHYVLEMAIHPNILLVIAGRDPIERSTPDGPKLWLPYHEAHVIHSLHVQPFTEEETRAYLVEKKITSEDHIKTIWQVSHGLPLYMGLLTTNSEGKVDPTKDVVENFLRWIPEREHRNTFPFTSLISMSKYFFGVHK